MKIIGSIKALSGLLTALLIGLFVSPMAMAAGYYTQAGKIYDPSGQEIQVRGISHYGFNADILQPQFLWAMGWKQQIAQIKSLGFNAVRLPFVPDTLYNTTPVDKLSYVDPNLNPELIGKTPLQVMDLWMAEADRQGLYVMLDFHSVSNKRQYPTWFVDNPADYGLIYNGQAYTEDNWVRDLKFVAQRYATLSHFFGIDIYNEPNGIVRWSTGDANAANPKNFWKPAVEKAAAGILQTNPNLLIFVQGITGNFDGIEDSNIPVNWGENLQPQAYQPLNVADTKLVFTPHTYGPDVYQKSSFSASNYPANLAANWEKLFGQFSSAHPVVVGEWGGRYGQGGTGQADVTWQNAFVDYLLSKGIHSSFYWCYTPNSGDTGGILDDNLNVRQDKMALLNKLWGPASTGAALAFSASSYTVAQSAGSLTVTVNRSGSTNGVANVNYATANGTAGAGTDYTAKSGTLNWAAGDTAAKSLSIAISNTAAFNGSKSFSVALSNPGSGSVLGSPSTANVTINGSSAVVAGSLALSASSYTVAQTAGSLKFSIKRTGGSSGSVNVQYSTVNGTAKAGTDYTATIGTWSWINGDMAARSFTVPVSNATPFSGSRNFNIKLSNVGGGATLGSPNTAVVTINGSKSAPPPPQTYAQQSINSFSPASGGVGTVVTLTGSGFTGSNAAWSGNGHDAGLSIVSDTQAKVTIPADATSGAIAILNPAHSAFTASSFTVTASAPAYAQQSISSFSPASGAVGTVVTLTGSGFTGSNAAWSGNGHDAGLTVISDTQANVTIPSDATSGAIAILNPAHAAFTASSFTVTVSAPTYAQQSINSFSPTSGAPGTVVTLIGSGFTNSNAAWSGNGHDAGLTVISDTQANVTIPADATTGAIAILNPAHASFTASSFTVSP